MKFSLKVILWIDSNHFILNRKSVKMEKNNFKFRKNRRAVKAGSKRRRGEIEKGAVWTGWMNWLFLSR
jgi:hypothetical protein